MVVKNLKSLKYHELQKLAKNAGIRANQKVNSHLGLINADLTFHIYN